jgi:hypothetical protein
MATLHYPIIIRSLQEGIIANVQNGDTEPLLPNELCSYTRIEGVTDHVIVVKTSTVYISRATVCGVVTEIINPGSRGNVIIMGEALVKGDDPEGEAPTAEAGIGASSRIAGHAGPIVPGYLLCFGQFKSIVQGDGQFVFYRIFMPGWRF